MRKILTKVGDTVGNFRYLRCLSDSESTVDGGNPEYWAECLSCGTERRLLYRNRNAKCSSCAEERRRRRTREGVQTFGSLQAKMLVLHPARGIGRTIIADLPEECFLRLSATEAEEAELWLVDEKGDLTRTFKKDYLVQKLLTVDDVVSRLGLPPLKPSVEETEETEEIDKPDTAVRRKEDAPPI